eukprot:9489038-Pyramimonas_sp.AAC.1
MSHILKCTSSHGISLEALKTSEMRTNKQDKPSGGQEGVGGGPEIQAHQRESTFRGSGGGANLPVLPSTTTAAAASRVPATREPAPTPAAKCPKVRSVLSTFVAWSTFSRVGPLQHFYGRTLRGA